VNADVYRFSQGADTVTPVVTPGVTPAPGGGLYAGAHFGASLDNMRRFHPSRFGWLLVLTLGLWAVVAQAQEYRYRYVSLLEVELPSGFIFFDPIAINNSGRIYGVAYDDLFIDPHVAVYADGAVTILQPGQPGASMRPTKAAPSGAVY
jgi:hypothetical protein